MLAWMSIMNSCVSDFKGCDIDFDDALHVSMTKRPTEKIRISVAEHRARQKPRVSVGDDISIGRDRGTTRPYEERAWRVITAPLIEEP